MSFIESARAFALDQAQAFENKARSIGIMRSVDATEAAAWLDDVAKNIRFACNPDDPDAPAEVLDQAELREASDAALAWLENMSRTTSREQLSRRLRRALGKPDGWKGEP
jgi:hypothetical protein